MVNFDPLMAKRCWQVWGTPANFNGLRVLAGTLVVGVSQNCGVEQRAPPLFGRAAITLGIGPVSRSSFSVYLLGVLMQVFHFATIDDTPDLVYQQ